MNNDQDFSDYLGKVPKTKKQHLLDKCKRFNVSVHIDSPSEQSVGVYADLFRGIASEAELERRLNAEIAKIQSSRANAIQLGALLVAVVAIAIQVT